MNTHIYTSSAALSPASGEPLVLHFTSEGATADALFGAFTGYGFQVQHCASLSAIHLYLGASAAGSAPDLAVLGGTAAENSAAALILRAVRPDIGIVVMADLADETALQQQLQSGADAYCSMRASSNLLVTQLLRLLWRIGKAGPVASGVTPTAANHEMHEMQAGSWRLIDHAWAMSTPLGKRVPLTTGERAFLSALFNAPNRQARHWELIQAVNAAYSRDSPREQQNRLGMTVSRLRAKFKEQGEPLPLKSIHNWGYMFKTMGVPPESPPPYCHGA